MLGEGGGGGGVGGVGGGGVGGGVGEGGGAEGGGRGVCVKKVVGGGGGGERGSLLNPAESWTRRRERASESYRRDAGDQRETWMDGSLEE